MRRTLLIDLFEMGIRKALGNPNSEIFVRNLKTRPSPAGEPATVSPRVLRERGGTRLQCAGRIRPAHALQP